MINFPNAKINLGLYITEKRADNFHNISTVFFPISLYDVLEILPSDNTGFHYHGLPIHGDNNDNLVLKAFNLIKNKYPSKISNNQFILLKAIPMGAGLGGGSSDAAFVLKMLNEFYKLQLNEAELLKLAIRLGSDCPFFVLNKPCYAEGRGEILTPITLSLSAYSIILVYPEIHISTKAAFSAIQPHSPKVALKSAIQSPIDKWKDCIINQFEATIFSSHPELSNIKSTLYRNGALYAAMSGSGSAIYGIFPKENLPNLSLQIPHKTFYLYNLI